MMLAVLTVLAMTLTVAPVKVFAATGAFTVTGGTDGTDYKYDNGVLTIKTDTPLTIKNTDPDTATENRIVVEKIRMPISH